MPAGQDPADPAVRLRLLDLLGGFLRTQALHTVAVLGIADLVGDEPVSCRTPTVLLEQVMPDGDTPSYAKLLDLIMLVLLGGKERTQSEWRSLLAAGGFTLVEITPRPATNLIEAAPA